MRLTVSQRLARKLKHAFDRHRGSRARFIIFSKTRPGGRAISPQNLSYFLNGRRPNPLGFDDLADIAAYFHVSVSELFDDDTELG